MIECNTTPVYSTEDIVNTLITCNETAPENTDAALTFASELTGISEDMLYQWMEEKGETNAD